MKMEGFNYISPLKMKRKELEDVNDDFSDFSLSSPARKIRRLDAELPPIMEEEESEVLPVFEQSMPQISFSSNLGQGIGGPVVIEELPENEERAIVLFKPMSTPFVQSPGFSVSSDIISELKNQVLWYNQSCLPKASEDEEQEKGSNQCLAVVPWAPSQLPPTHGAQIQQPDISEMETEEMEAVKMDIEDESIGIEQRPGNEFGGTSVGEGLHQWQQQHCMVPQLPQSSSAPIIWYQ